MPRLRSESSRSYPGRPDRQATLWGSVSDSNAGDDRSGVSRGHSTCSHTGKGRTQEGIGVSAGRRLRMCFWKQWRYARTKVRNLVKLGTHLKTAIDTAISRKGPWRLSRTLATQTGMTNQWLADLGLLNVKELWCKIHYPASPRTAR